MRGAPTDFWGKLQRRNDQGPVAEWHPLVDHCADVASVAEALLRLPTWKHRLTRLARCELGEVLLARLAVLAAIHDLGKFNLGFQAKGCPELGPTAGHVSEALAAFLHQDLFPSLHAHLGRWGEGVTGMLVAAICHHGRPYNQLAAESAWQATWWTPRGGLDPRRGAARLIDQCRCWFPAAFASVADPIPDVAELGHAFAGLVMLADWIGSDTRFFPFSDHGDPDRMEFARRSAQRAIAGLTLDVPLEIRSDRAHRDAFSRVAPSGYTPRPAQVAINSIPLDAAGSISVLEAETGSGKTEAALMRFVRLFEEGLVDGLYFALPTRTAAMQMHRRVYEAAQRAFAPPPAVVLAVPGYLRVDETEGQRLPRFEVLWPDSDRFRYRAWAAENTKRYLAGCIVVGTIDQVLLSSLMVSHAHLRATALLRHLLVVDEVHASDAYMTRILQAVLERHMAAGGHALLLSATLGAETRERLLRPEARAATLPTLADAQSTPYPLVTHRAALVRAFAIAREKGERVVQVTEAPWLDDSEAVAAAALDAATSGAKVIVVKNTVTDCLATQTALERLAKGRGLLGVLFECTGVNAPHHSRFSRVDREALDTALERHFGKTRPGGGCVVVATQTVQQSLDLDADILFSDLCPADVLLQRLGRLHRHHERLRPAGYDVARGIVVVPARRDLGILLSKSGQARNHHGLGSVYPDLRVLEATWRVLHAHHEWRVPAMSRQIVESSLHSAVLKEIVREGDERWLAHEAHMIGGDRGQRRLAELNLVDWKVPYDGMSFPDAVDKHIATRLGEGDRRVQFQPTFTGPFGQVVSELVLRSWWVGSVAPDDHEAEGVTTTADVTRFALGAKHFVYDRFGVRPHTPSSQEAVDDDGP